MYGEPERSNWRFGRHWGYFFCHILELILVKSNIAPFAFTVWDRRNRLISWSNLQVLSTRHYYRERAHLFLVCIRAKTLLSDSFFLSMSCFWSCPFLRPNFVGRVAIQKEPAVEEQSVFLENETRVPAGNGKFRAAQNNLNWATRKRIDKQEPTAMTTKTRDGDTQLRSLCATTCSVSWTETSTFFWLVESKKEYYGW